MRKVLSVVAIVCLSGVAVFLVFQKRSAVKLPMPVPSRSPPGGKDEGAGTIATNPAARIPTNLLNLVRVRDLSEAERIELARNFEQKYKPAVMGWFKAYEDRLPFRPEDLTLDRFTERIGKNASFYLYTFVIGDITLTIQDSNGKAKVFYMMSRQGAKELNSLPGGEPPHVEMPVGRDDVGRMVKADTGAMFKPNEIILRQTGFGTALNGGASVDIGPRDGNPDIGPSKIHMVFGPDGKLVTYSRDPFF